MERKVYTYKEVYESTLYYFNGDELATSVWINKYALRNDSGEIYELNPYDMHMRLTKEIYIIEKGYYNSLSENEIFESLKSFDRIILGGSISYGLGSDKIISLSNCFVIGSHDRYDSYGGIIRYDEELAQLMKRRGGVGLNMSFIRPENSVVLNSSLSSTGVYSYLQRYAHTTEEVAQNGRRGALILLLSSRHPDILRFITAKNNTSNTIKGANLSVLADDEFMIAVTNNDKYILKYPVDEEDLSKCNVVREVNAIDIWNAIVDNNHDCGDPGILFWDTVINESLTDCYKDYGFKTIGVNPCAELPLPPYDSCRLLHLNLFTFVINPFTKDAKFDYAAFDNYCNIITRISDDIIDLEIEYIDRILSKIDSDPEPNDIKYVEKQLWIKIKDKAIKGRTVGIGVLGFGDMLSAMNIRYGSIESIDLIHIIYKRLAIDVYTSSIRLSRERYSFPIYNSELEIYSKYLSRISDADTSLTSYLDGRRNISLLTCAPTGTGSIMAQTTSGIEPLYKFYYRRRKRINSTDINVNILNGDKDVYEEYNVIHEKFIMWYHIYIGKDINDKISYNETKKIMMHMSENELNELYKLSPYFGSSAYELNVFERIDVQAAIQKWIDHSISSTINLPNDATKETISEIYKYAWKSGLKGVTVFRDGCKEGILSSVKNKDNHATKRPTSIECKLFKFRNKHDKDDMWISFIGMLDNRPYEIFTGSLSSLEFNLPDIELSKFVIIKDKNNSGHHSRYNLWYYDKNNICTYLGNLAECFNREYHNYAKLVSGLLRHNMPLNEVVKTINNLNISSEISTWKYFVIKSLSKCINDGVKVSVNRCPNCGSNEMVYQEGCPICKSCGASSC